MNEPTTVKEKNGDSPMPRAEALSASQQQLVQMRPTLIVGAGGTGQIILTILKAILQFIFGDRWRRRIRLLAFDTTKEDFQVEGLEGPVTLEAGAEFFDIGDVPVGSIVRNIESQVAIKERLGPVLSRLPAGVMRSGSKQLRSLGLMAFMWNHAVVREQIERALRQLAGRGQYDDALNLQQGINVFVCGSLVGGTGSGVTLDLAYLIRSIFTDLGTQAEFCHITSVNLLPQAFHGVKGPNLLPNTAAYLQELNHLMVKGNFQTRYPDGRFFTSREAPFDICYVADGVDQNGRVWADVYAVANMAAQCIYLQMATQLGRKGENSFDNLDEILSGVTADGQGTFLASFGKGDLVFDAPAVARICARQLLVEWLQQVWLRPSDPDVVRQLADPLLDGVKEEQIRPSLQRDPETGGEFHVDLTQPGWLQRKPVAEVAAEAARYIGEYGQARVIEKMLPQIGRNGQTLATSLEAQWTDWLQSILFAPGISLNTAQAALEWLRDQFAGQMKTTQKEVIEQERQQSRLEQAVTQAETAVSKAAASFPLGRSGRIRESLAHAFRAAQTLYDQQMSLHTHRAALSLWHVLHNWARSQAMAIAVLRDRTAGCATQTEAEVQHRVKQVSRSGVASFSLADPAYVQTLFEQYKPAQPDLKEGLTDPLALCGLKRDSLAERLVQAVQRHFAPIAAMTIEEVIQARAGEMSPRARRQQLFQLATPSWNVDRARLPEGGAHLVRLELLGVPDATHSLFEGEPMLVSTHDPHRLTALVVSAGAPPSALQQYDQYVAALEQVRGKRPIHVLPDFLVTADQGRLYFALGSIFGLIYSQGTFFYYQPADPLETAVKLANGLSNAIHVFSEQEELVNEVNERVERQIARLGLREAIRILTGYYANASSNGSTALDDQLRELKRLVRDYTDGLRRIDAFSAGIDEDVTRNP